VSMWAGSGNAASGRTFCWGATMPVPLLRRNFDVGAAGIRNTGTMSAQRTRRFPSVQPVFVAGCCDPDVANRPIVKSCRYRLGGPARSTTTSLPVPQRPSFSVCRGALPGIQARVIGGQSGFRKELTCGAHDSPGIGPQEGREQSWRLNRPVCGAKSHVRQKTIWNNYF